MRITVIGAGSWGTTLAVHLVGNNHDVRLWEFDAEQAERLKQDRVNEMFLPGVPFPDEVSIFDNLSDSVSDAELLVFAVPSHFMRSTAAQLSGSWNAGGSVRAVVSVAKGLETDSLERMTEVLSEELAGIEADILCVLSGPSHAEEVSRGIATAIVAASVSAQTAALVQDAFFSKTLRVYTGDDPVGVEYGGALKNIIAIAAGICDGAGFGDNTKAALMTRGLAEITRLGVSLGAKQETYGGLAGMGDLIVTCLSRHSRNRYVGEEIGKGRSLEDVLAGMTMVAEGVKTTSAVSTLAEREGLEMPISGQVHAVLFEGKSPRDAVEELMSRDRKAEGLSG